MNILAIETSCDETSVAILRDGRHVLANIVASQIDLHKQWGGVVPELASRQHIVNIVPVLQEAFKEANLDWPDIDAIAVTSGPGLAGALLVGLNAAKALAFAHNKPLISVNHLEGHIYSNWVVPETLTNKAPTSGKNSAKPRRTMPDPQATEPTDPRFPLLGLIVSGGHTELVYMAGHGQYTLLGKTVDDAAGEAFDKVARILGLPYPGGPEIQKAAENGDPNSIELPRRVMRGSYDFSFSGLKTAVLHKVQEYGPALGPEEQQAAEIAAVTEQQHAEQPGRLDRNRRNRQQQVEPQIADVALEAAPVDLPANPTPVVASAENTAPVAQEPIVITNWQTSNRHPAPVAPAPESIAQVEPGAEPEVEIAAPVDDSSEGSGSWTGAAMFVDDSDEQSLSSAYQAPQPDANADVPGLIRLRPSADTAEGAPVHRTFEFHSEPEAPLASKETPADPRVLGRDEAPVAEADLPPFLAARSGEAPAEPATSPQTNPAEAEIPGFLRQRGSRADQRAQRPIVEPPAPPSGPRRYDIPAADNAAAEPEQSEPTPAPKAQPGKTPASRLRSLKHTMKPEPANPIIPIETADPEPESTPATQAETAPEPVSAPTINQEQKPAERSSEREIHAIPKAAQATRSTPEPEDDEFQDLFDDSYNEQAQAIIAARQPKQWNSWIDDEESDKPGPGKGGTVALEGPRRPEASARVGGKEKNDANKPPLPVADVAAAFQAAVAEILSEKVATAAAAYEVHTILLAGGVAANKALRARLQERLGGQVELRFPPAALCTDNAAMIAAAAYFRFDSGLQHNWALDIDPNASYIRD